MPFLRFILALAALCATLWALSTSFSIKGNSLPPLGHFFNPFSGFWQNAEKLSVLSPSANPIRIASLKGEVSVAMDDLGIPHVFAENMHDALAVQGYLTAKDRLFQMDISARKSLGRLSEIVGERTIEIDRKSIRKGLALGVDRAVMATKQSPESSALLDAYLSGVNAWIGQLSPAQYPIEYKLLNAAPEAWTQHHALAVIEGMSDALVARNDDVKNSKNLEVLGADLYHTLFPRYNPDQTPVIPDNGQWKEIKAPLLQKSKTNESAQGVGSIFAEGVENLATTETAPQIKSGLDYHQSQSGSNNWALSGSRTATGKPLLANDPHLNLTLPSIWYQVQIHTPECNVYGVSLPGVPGVIIGFNEHIAWGMTNVSHDVGDYFRIKWTDATKTKYLIDGKEETANLEIHSIKVKGREQPILDTVRMTTYGPVQSIDPQHAECDLAYRWMPQFEPSPDLIMEFSKLNQAKNYDAYRASIRHFDAPAQNFVFASRSGDVALTAQGKYPIRAPQTAEFVQDGSISANGWQGFVPFDHVPFQKNPSRGFVYSANQHSTPPSYPYPYYGYFDDYRGRYIHSRLTEAKAFTTDSMAAIQLSNHLQMKDDALPAMLAILDTSTLDAASLALVNQLRNWDGNFGRNSVEGVVFELWHTNMYEMTFDEFLTKNASTETLALPDNWVLYHLLKKQPKHRIFDIQATTEQETATEIGRAALTEALKEYAVAVASGKGTWADFRGMSISHIARMPGFGREVVTDGHPSAPNANKNGHGPSWRMIVDLQDSVRALGVYPGGQSGNPGSKHYDDMLEYWAEGKYYECLFLRSQDQKSDRIKFIQKFTRA